MFDRSIAHTVGLPAVSGNQAGPTWRENPHETDAHRSRGLPLVPSARSQTQGRLGRSLARVDDGPGASELDQVLRSQLAQTKAILVQRPDQHSDQSLACFVIRPPLVPYLLQQAVTPAASRLLGHAFTVATGCQRTHPSFCSNSRLGLVHRGSLATAAWAVWVVAAGPTGNPAARSHVRARTM